MSTERAAAVTAFRVASDRLAAAEYGTVAYCQAKAERLDAEAIAAATFPWPLSDTDLAVARDHRLHGSLDPAVRSKLPAWAAGWRAIADVVGKGVRCDSIEAAEAWRVAVDAARPGGAR